MIEYKRNLTLDVYDYSGNKICPLYTSLSDVESQAYDVFITKERNGWKELSFSIPADSDKAQHVRADFKIKATEGEDIDWYIITTLKLTHDGKRKVINVTAGHISQILKTKNLSLEFSDDYGNNIGTAEELLTTVLEGTGWSVGDVAVFYEKDGHTVKKRTLKASTKTGAFKLITMISDLFEAKPVFNGAYKTVDMIPMNPFSYAKSSDLYSAVQTYANGNVLELHYGTNISNVSRQHNTENMVTKLYAYGSYGDDVSKYCGIEECSHTEHRFTLTNDLNANTRYYFTVQDDSGVNVTRSFITAEAINSGDVLIWSFLDPASMMYIWDDDTETAYMLTDSTEGTLLPAVHETESVDNVFSFIMDFSYYGESGLISNSVLQSIAKLQRLGRDYLLAVQEASADYSESLQELTSIIGIVDYVKLDIDSIGYKTIDGNNYTKLTLTDDRIQYRTDYDSTTHFKWRVANSIKSNGDAINNEASVVYVIHSTTPVTYDKYYLREINDIDDPSVLVLWANSGAVSATDECYLFSSNSVNGLLGAYESANESLVQTLNSTTKRATVEHPVFFSTTAPAIANQSSAIDLPIPEWLDYNKTYAWWYKYNYSTEGELYFCYYSDGDSAWKRVYVSKTTPIVVANAYWYNWQQAALYRGGNGEWDKLDRTDDLNIAALFGTVYYSCRRYDKYQQGIYQKYTLTGTFAPKNYYMPNEYGELYVFTIQKSAKKLVLDTTDGFIAVTPTDTNLAEESIDVQMKRYDNVSYHPYNVFETVAFETGSISTSTGGDIDSGTGYRTSSAGVYPNLTYDIDGVAGQVTVCYYSLKHDFITYTTINSPASFVPPANTRYIRLASNYQLSSVVCHVHDYNTAIIVKDETYYLAGTPSGSGTLKGILPLIDRFATVSDLTYETNLAAIEAAQAAYSAFEAEVAEGLGDLYKESTWQDSNYVDGDEQKLYDDAIDNLKEIARPATTYTITFLDRRCENLEAVEPGATRWPEFDENSAAHLIDPELNINCWAYIDKVRKCYDRPWQTTISINTNLSTLSQHSFSDVMTNIANVAKSVKAKESVYDRSSNISGSGKVTTEKLEGTIDANRLKITGGSSTWYTNEDGNMVFESADGTSAMMISGNGFAIASAKDKYGDWIWRSFGGGEGFTADEIVTGYLSAERIEAGSITTDKISSTFGETLDLTSNTGINLKIADLREDVEGEIEDVQSELTLTSDKLEWIVNGDGQQTEFSVTPDAMRYVGQNVDMTLNNGFNVTIHGLQDGVTSVIGELENTVEPTIENIQRWMTFGPDGLRQGKDGSPYSTLIDNEGYHIDKSTVLGQHVGSFTANGLVTSGIKIGNLIVKPTSAGGWAWTEV